MKIPVKSFPQSETDDGKYMRDLTRVVSNPKMFVNEKNMLLRYAELLYETGFYVDNDSIFDIIEVSK